MSMVHGSSRRRQRGGSLIEVMISMGIFAVAIMGVVSGQVLAAAQNGMARRTSRAAAIARDFVETAQRWEYDDPRLTASAACGAVLANFPATEVNVGTAKAPAYKLGFTATPAAVTPESTNEANNAGGLTYSSTTYDGTAPLLLGDARKDRFQLLWTVQEINTNGALTGCEGKLVSVVVRYPVGNAATSGYRNLVTTFFKTRLTNISLALPEQIP